MTLFLDHHQRLNLVALLGLLECNVGEMRATWKLLDLLALDEGEKSAIGFWMDPLTEMQGWDRTKGLPPRSYDLDPGDIRRIERAVQQFPRHRVGMARYWLEPLLEQLPELEFAAAQQAGKQAWATS